MKGAPNTREETMYKKLITFKQPDAAPTIYYKLYNGSNKPDVWYCPECHANNQYNNDIKDIVMFAPYNSKHYNGKCYKKIIKLTCAHCGKTIYAYDIDVYSETEYTVKFAKVLKEKMTGVHVSLISYEEQKNFTETHIVYNLVYVKANGYLEKQNNTSVFYDEEAGKFKIFTSTTKFKALPNILLRNTCYHSTVFNVKTHRVTTIHSADNPKKAGVVTSIQNRTYTFNNTGAWMHAITLQKSSIVAKDVLKAFCSVTGMYDFSDCVKSNKKQTEISSMFAALVTATRFPSLMMSYDDYTGAIEYTSEYTGKYFTREFLANFPKELMDRQKLIREMTAKLKIPNTPRFWKQYLNRLANMDEVLMYKKCGFKNPESLYYLLTHPNNACRAFGLQYSMHPKEFKQIRQMLKRMVQAHDEYSVAKKMCCETDIWSTLYDSVYMFSKIMEINSDALDDINWRQSLKEIHDDLSHTLQRVRFKNVTIPYSNDETALESVVQDIEFKLALDTDELNAIGDKMSICVGSYRQRVLDKQDTIVYMKRNNQYVGCIELAQKTTQFELVQVKAKYNKLLNGDAMDIFDQWAEDKQIQTQDCYDWQKMHQKAVVCGGNNDDDDFWF